MKSRFLLMMMMLLAAATSFASINLQKYSMSLTAATATAGKTVDVTLSMKNDKAIASWATTLALPEGVTFVSATTAGTRYGEVTPAVTSQVNKDGTVSLMCEPDAAMTGTYGAVATITLKVDATVAAGAYTLTLKGATLVDIDDKTWTRTKDVEATLTVADNIVFFDNTEVFSGTTTSVPLYMNNKDEITGVQFDMTLPTGVTLDGKVTVNTTDGRATSVSHSVTSSLNNGKVRVICYSMSSEAFSGESGAIFNIPLKVDESLAEGTYNVKFDDIVLSETDGKTKHTVKSSVSQLEVVPGNVLLFDKGEAFLGLTTSVPLCLNKDDISSVQFDMTLPTGVTLDGNVTVNTTDGRATSDSHEVQTSVLSDGKIRVKCYSTKSIAFEGESGAILDIPLKVDESVKVGTYNVEFSDITMTKTSGFNHIVKSFVSELAVNNVPNDPSLFDNIVFFNKGNVYPGLTTSVPLYMNNKDKITAVQFDMTLPDGVALDGNVTINTTDGRATSASHIVTSSVQSNGKVRVICYSMSSEAFKGESGAIFNIPLKVDESMVDGIYSVRFDDIILTEADGKTKHTVKSFLTQLEVVETVIGDCNSDGCVDVADIVTLVNYILGKTPANFVESAADVNGDSSIDVADIVSLVNILLHPQNSGSAKVNARRVEESADSEANTLTITPFEITKGDSKTVTLDLYNTDSICAFQCNLYLPEGITASKISSANFNSDANRTDATCHVLSSAVQSDGSLKMICYSMENSTFKGTDGALVDIPLSCSADMEAGSYEYSIKNIVLSRPDGVKFTPSDYTGTMSVGDPDGINDVDATESGDGKVFNLSGVRLNAPVKGKINIVNNRKVLVR